MSFRVIITSTPTATRTPVPPPALVCHFSWQGPPPQPHERQQLPITLTLKLGSIEINYPSQSTDASGTFSVPLADLPAGTYEWRVKGPRYLANSGSVTLTGAEVTTLEAGLMRAGDCNNDNVVNAVDFNILRATFGLSGGQQGYDDRADFNADRVVNAPDFNMLRSNFGSGGAPPLRAHMSDNP